MGFHDNSTGVVEPDLKSLLKDLEEKDSLLEGTIVDIATVNSGDPFENFDIDPDRLIESSKSLIMTMATSPKYQECITVAVELPSGDVFVDLFTYEDSSTNEYPAIENLARILDVDISSVHHVVGKDVLVLRKDGRWRVIEHMDTPPTPPTVTRQDALVPVVISGFLLAFGALVGYLVEGISLLLAVAGSFVVSGGLLLVLFYITFAIKRDHPLPGIVERFVAPMYTTDIGELHDSKLSSVQNGELKRIDTKEDNSNNHRSMVKNMFVVVGVPPEGDLEVAIPAPFSSWHGTRVKRLLYHLSPSVEYINQQEEDLIPLRKNNGRVEVDPDRLPSDPARNRTTLEVIADAYVNGFNDLFGIESRQDRYN